MILFKKVAICNSFHEKNEVKFRPITEAFTNCFNLEEKFKGIIK